MGGGGGTSKSKTSSGTSESALSKEQLRILQERDAWANSYWFPEYENAMSELNANSEAGVAKNALQASAINQAYGASERQINQNLAQQGMLGDASGVQAAMKAANERSRSSALAEAYYNTIADNSTAKANLLGIGSSMVPTPTTSAQYHQSSKSQTEQSNFDFRIL